jgi:hypothetical protein
LVGGKIATIEKEEMRASAIDSLVYLNAKFLGEDGGKNWMYFEKSILWLPLSLLGKIDTEAEEKNEKSTLFIHIVAVNLNKGANEIEIKYGSIVKSLQKEMDSS